MDEALHHAEPIVGDVGPGPFDPLAPEHDNPGAVWNHAIEIWALQVIERQSGETCDPRMVRVSVPSRMESSR